MTDWQGEPIGVAQKPRGREGRHGGECLRRPLFDRERLKGGLEEGDLAKHDARLREQPNGGVDAQGAEVAALGDGTGQNHIDGARPLERLHVNCGSSEPFDFGSRNQALLVVAQGHGEALLSEPPDGQTGENRQTHSGPITNEGRVGDAWIRSKDSDSWRTRLGPGDGSGARRSCYTACMDASPDEIPGFFDQYGWRFERRGLDLFLSGFSGESGRYEIWVRVADPWIYFTINPYVPKPDGREHPSNMHALILQANHQLNMAKFALDSDGDVSLSVEMPTEGFTYSHFADAMTALSVYADEYRGRFDDACQESAGEVV